MEQPIRVCMVHDHQLLSDVIMARLHQEDMIVLSESAALDCKGMIQAEHFRPFDVALIDATMTKRNALHVTREIKRIFSMVKAIVLGLEHRGEEVLRFIEAGANGYVLKDASYPELLQTIRAVYSGHTPCSPRIAALVFARIAALAREQSQHQHLPQVRLSPREGEVLQLIVLGRRNGEIAHALGIAMDTVKRHVANIFEKFQVQSWRAVIQQAAEYGMLKEAAWVGQVTSAREGTALRE